MSFLMTKFSSNEIERQYNLIKLLLSESEKYKDALEAIRKDIAFMPKELKKKLEEENIVLWINSSKNFEFYRQYERKYFMDRYL